MSRYRIFLSVLSCCDCRLTACMVAIMASSCANKVAPTGGAKDTSPPAMLSSLPENYSTEFKGNSIVIRFDEYIALDNAASQIITTPLMTTPPEFSVSKKSLEIKFKESLLPSTTYTINFGKALRDVHEANVLSPFSFVFSTGSFLDTASLHGTVMNALNQTPEKDVLVMLYPQGADSLVKTGRPVYFGRTNENGQYFISHIKDGRYEILALKDKNSNYQFDLEDEEIGFAGQTVQVSDSTASDLLLFKNAGAKLRIKSITQDEPGMVCIVFNRPPVNLSYQSFKSEKREWAFEEKSLLSDSIIFWVTDTTADSLRVIFQEQEKIVDTLMVKLNRKSASRGKGGSRFLGFTTNLQQTLLEQKDSLKLFFSRPVANFDPSKILLEKDSVPVTEPRILEYGPSKRNFIFDISPDEKAAYGVKIFPGAFTDYYHVTNDTSAFSFRIRTGESYGALQVRFKQAVHSGEEQFIFQLLNASGIPIRSLFLQELRTVQISQLLPGSYRMRIIFDSNRNNQWDAGNYEKKIQPEKVMYHPQTITIRSNWDLETEWDIKP